MHRIQRMFLRLDLLRHLLQITNLTEVRIFFEALLHNHINLRIFTRGIRILPAFSNSTYSSCENTENSQNPTSYLSLEHYVTYPLSMNSLLLKYSLDCFSHLSHCLFRDLFQCFLLSNRCKWGKRGVRR